jgi:hypothetical protein
MADAAGWLALAATCVAALMTASNLGARVTGWGFVIFTIGAAAWIVVGLATGQKQLLYSNIFLGVVDLFGIWRWLGRRVRISGTAAAEVERSRERPGENLFSLGSLDGLPVKSQAGETVAYAVDALAACGGGRIDYLIVRTGGVGGLGETLHRLPWSEVAVEEDHVRSNISAVEVARLPLAEARKR